LFDGKDFKLGALLGRTTFGIYEELLLAIMGAFLHGQDYIIMEAWIQRFHTTELIGRFWYPLIPPFVYTRFPYALGSCEGLEVFHSGIALLNSYCTLDTIGMI
jgi:hypothetical protein